MEEAFGIVLLVVVAIGAVIALVTVVTARGLYNQIGRGSFGMDRAERRPAAGRVAPTPVPKAGSAGALERAEEIRQMLRARNARRRRRGQPELDVEDELARLTAPAAAPAGEVDPELVEEVRQLVLARNRRRARQGKPPLDVEDEIQRQLRDAGA
jgi:hypothetical protein